MYAKNITRENILEEFQKLQKQNAILTKENKQLLFEKTKHMNVDKKFTEDEEKYRIHFESSKDAVMILTPSTCIFTAGNRSAIEMFNAEDEKKLISKKLWELSPKYQSDGQLSSVKIKKMIEKAMKTGSHFFEWTHKRINNKEFPATILFTKLTSEHKPLLEVTVKDITKRKKAEEELKKQLEGMVKERTIKLKHEMIEQIQAEEKLKSSTLLLHDSETRYRTIFETANVAIWEEDFTELKAAIDAVKAQGVADFRSYLKKHPEFVEQAMKLIKILNVNDEALIMYGAHSKEELLASLDRTFVPESLHTFEEELIAIAEGKRTFEAEEITQNLQGERVDVLLKLSIPASSESFGHILISMMDITERKKAQEELINHQKHIKLINRILRHDIANNFAVIQSALNIYKQSHENQMLEEANKQIQKGSLLIRRMKQLEEFLTLDKTLKVRDLNSIINRIALSYPALEINIIGKAKVLANDAIDSVFDNLFNNALIHAEADVIDVSINKLKNSCTIRVADNGKGIPDKIKNKVFDESFKYGEKGHTGLGLYIVKKTIESFNGSIRLENNEPKGAIFIITLHLVQ